MLASLKNGKEAGNDPWDGFTLEWTTSSPPPRYDFATIPTVHSLRPLWEQKHGEDQKGVTPKVETPKDAAQREIKAAARQAPAIHMPAGSWAPIIMGLGLMIFGYGMIYTAILAIIGGLITFYGILRFVWEKP